MKQLIKNIPKVFALAYGIVCITLFTFGYLEGITNVLDGILLVAFSIITLLILIKIIYDLGKGEEHKNEEHRDIIQE